MQTLRYESLKSSIIKIKNKRRALLTFTSASVCIFLRLLIKKHLYVLFWTRFPAVQIPTLGKMVIQL